MKNYQKKILASSLVLLLCIQSSHTSVEAFPGFEISCQCWWWGNYNLNQKYKNLKQNFANETAVVQNTNNYFNEVKTNFLENHRQEKDFFRVFERFSERAIDEKINNLQQNLAERVQEIQNSIERLKATCEEYTYDEMDSSISQIESEIVELQNLNENCIIEFSDEYSERNVKNVLNDKLSRMKNLIETSLDFMKTLDFAGEEEKLFAQTSFDLLLSVLNGSKVAIPKDNLKFLHYVFFNKNNDQSMAVSRSLFPTRTIDRTYTGDLGISSDLETNKLIAKFINSVVDLKNVKRDLINYFTKKLKKEVVDFCMSGYYPYDCSSDSWCRKNEKFLLNNRGWKIHITPNVRHCKEVLEVVDAMSDEIGFAFKVNKKINRYAQDVLFYGVNDSQRGKYITIYPNSDEIAKEISEKLNEEFQKRGFTDKDFIELRYDFKIYPGIYTRFTSYDDSDGSTRGKLGIPTDTLLKYQLTKSKITEDTPVDSIKEAVKFKKESSEKSCKLKDILANENILRYIDLRALIDGKIYERVEDSPSKDIIHKLASEIREANTKYSEILDEKISPLESKYFRMNTELESTYCFSEEIEELANQYQHPFEQLSIANVVMSKNIAEINKYLSDSANKTAISDYFGKQYRLAHNEF